MDNQIEIVNKNISNSTVNNYATQVIGKSYEHNELLDQLKTQQKLFNLTPEDEQDERLEISAKINELENRIKQFKDDVLRLAQQFNRIEINTDRLKSAKEFFDKGEIGEARAVLEMELEQMTDENTHLIKQREHFEQDVLPKLKANSEEFFILALSTQTNYANPNWFDDTCAYFERSIDAFATKDNTFQYAEFLQNHNKYDKAERYFQNCLNNFTSVVSPAQRALILNNLGVLYKNSNKIEKAFAAHNEALAIRQELAKQYPETYNYDLAVTLDNLANLHGRLNKFDVAASLSQKSLEIFEALANENPSKYLPDLVINLGNLARFYKINGEYDKAIVKYDETIKIYRELININPILYLPDYVRTLNSLAMFYQLKQDFKAAIVYFNEALEILENLVKINPLSHLPNKALIQGNYGSLFASINQPILALVNFKESTQIYEYLAIENFQTYFPNLALNYSNLSVFYLQNIPNREESISYAIKAIKIILPNMQNVPSFNDHFQRAISVLRDWGLSADEINNLLK